MALKPASLPDESALAALLRANGARCKVGELRALVAGVAAAHPPGHEWMSLVAPKPSPALEEALSALLAKARAQAQERRSQPESALSRLARLRAELKRRGLAGFLVPRADEHQGEYVARRAQRLAWLTGFTGSAGLALVLETKAALFVDGRYTLQAKKQADGALYELRHVTDEPPAEWLAENLKAGQRIGFDPWLHTKAQVERFRKACERAGALLVALDSNPLDAVWTNRPPAPLSPVVPHPLDYAGQPSAEKRGAIGAALAKGGAEAAFVSAPDSIAWLLNVRGFDVPCTPLPLSFALVFADGRVEWFVEPRKITPGLEDWLGAGVALHAPGALASRLKALTGKTVRLDPDAAPFWAFERLTEAGARCDEGEDPCQLPKACKNETELAGARAAHLRDGAALARFLSWLERAVANGGVSELGAAAKLASFREQNALYRGPSFETISGSGPDGAIVHYRATEESDRAIGEDDVYLVDSGGQYLDGTTDVTRTLAFRDAGDEARERFTRVLKGHIALACAHFPEGTTGQQLDALARRALWEAGLDYDHGTGHGVGSYLGVHEGPQRISKAGSAVALKAGMIVSNEPGYYKTDGYGIRIENLVAVAARGAPQGAEKSLLGFETLTLAPIDLKLIEPSLLDAAEKAWLDGYHARVRERLTPLLDSETARWLDRATRPLGQA